MNNVIEINKQHNQRLLDAMRRDGLDKLHILSDFDRTLTTAYVNGEKVPSLISVLRDHNYLTPDYPSRAQAEYEKYHAIEIDPSIPESGKREYMREWWSNHFQLLRECGLTRDDIKEAMTSGHVRLREGAIDFFRLLRQNNIPLVIMSSSGIGYDSIQIFLEHHGLMHDNIHIISNILEWNSAGRFVRAQEPIIHGMNKDETMIKKFPVYKKVKERTNVLLLGDSPSDADMVTGFAYTHLFAVGFLNENVGTLLSRYKHRYNAIITNDGPMDYVNHILTEMIHE